MSNYTKNTNFASKDSLLHGNPAKVVKGTEIDTEFNSIQTAIATKLDASGGTLTSGTISGGTISGGTISGITDLAVADGGTGASTAADARTNLGALSSVDPSYTGTLTGGTGVINIGSGQVYKDSSGNVGIGVTPSAWSASYKALQFSTGGLAVTGTIQFLQNNGYNDGSWKFYGTGYANQSYIDSSDGSTTWRVSTASGSAGGAVTWSTQMKLDASGNLLVNETSAIGQFVSTYSGASAGYAAGVFKRSSSDGYAVGFVRGSTEVGKITLTTSTTTYATSSDYRLKDNVQPMHGALALVTQLKPCTYTWKVDGSNGQGFIAHELQAVVPECVVGEKDAVDADGNPVYQGIDTSFLVATLTAAIQELAKTSVEQQAIIQTLTSVTQQLQADVAALKAA